MRDRMWGSYATRHYHLRWLTVAWPHDIHAKEQVYLLVAAVFC